MSKTTFLTDELLDHVYRNLAYTQPATVYAGLFEAVTTKETGTGTETAYTGYARQAITFGAPAAGDQGGRKIDNSAAITFPQKTDAPQNTIIAVSVHDAVTAGNVLFMTMLDGGKPFMAVVEDADLAADLITAPGHGLVNDDRFRLEQFGGVDSLPTGLLEDTTYFVTGTPLADTFVPSLTQDGPAVNITAIGEMLVQRLTPKVLDQNDTPEFAANQLVIEED